MNALIVIGIVAVIVIVAVASMYNGLVKLRNNRENAFANIDVQLKQRYDLVPQLVNTVKGNAIIGDNNPETENGHVYGSGMGELGYADLTYVYNTDVTVNGNATVKGSVFGGGEVGHVKGHTVTGNDGNVAFNGDTRVTIGGNSTVGLSGIHDNTVGNVFGGGLGNSESQTAGSVDGIAHAADVDITQATV